MWPLSDFMPCGSSRSEIVGVNASVGFLAGAVISEKLGFGREVCIFCAAAGCIIGGLIGARDHDKILQGVRERVWSLPEADQNAGGFSDLGEQDQETVLENYGIVDCD